MVQQIFVRLLVSARISHMLKTQIIKTSTFEMRSTYPPCYESFPSNLTLINIRASKGNHGYSSIFVICDKKVRNGHHQCLNGSRNRSENVRNK